jgi:predicted enzyme related to lactoylglutathione lyase
MIPLRDLFEAHLTVSDLSRSMAFFGDLLQLATDKVFKPYERRILTVG